MSTGHEAHAPTAGEYIVHHLTHLNSTGHAQTAIIDWSVWNLDTLFFSIGLGIVTLLIDAEMKMFDGLPTPVIWLQNVVTDLLLGITCPVYPSWPSWPARRVPMSEALAWP